ncbi:MAG TPA: hypothetical protein VFO55_10905 [Gemmatimonadaceae bacterium]|nr:hypothetical protein [Gemmatimonadaceae bacterium]
MPSLLRASLFTATVFSVACGGSKPAANSTTPEPESHPLSGIVGQNIIIAPVQAMRAAPELGWTGLPAARPLLARLDSAIADSVRSRVGNLQWVFADGVAKAAANNPTYATDPRALAVNPLRSPALKVNDRLPEPLASQLRTMIAFQDARLVLVPVELRFERTEAGLGRPAVRLVLVDPRLSVVRWIGEVKGADSPAFTPDYFVPIAARFADLFVAK